MNYDKWNLVDVSSDDDDPADYHPNVDPKLIRRLKKEKKQNDRQEELQRLRQEAKKQGEEAEAARKILAKYEEAKKIPLHRDVSNRTVINRSSSKDSKPDWIPRGPSTMPGQASGDSAAKDAGQKQQQQQEPGVDPFADTDEGFAEFSKRFKPLVLRYARITDYEDLEQFLLDNHRVMLHKHAQSVLLLSMLDLEMKGDTATMKKYCRQYLMLANILDLAKGLKTDPRAALKPFFERVQTKESQQNLVRETENFARGIQKRAEQKKLEEAEEEDDDGLRGVEELSREERLGPGGLDPVEVFAELPPSWQEAFSSRDMDKLQLAIRSVPLEEAKRLIKMCEDSGLWNPGPAGSEDGDDDENENENDQAAQEQSEAAAAAAAAPEEAKE